MNSIHLQIVSLDGKFFDGEAKQVSIRTIDGDVAIRSGHIPFVTAIGTGECRVYVEDTSNPRIAAAIGGFIHVTREKVLIAATTFEWAEDIDAERALTAKEKAEQIISAGNADSHEIELAKLKLSRAKARIQVTNKLK